MKICGQTERGQIQAIMLILWQELSDTKQDKDFVFLRQLDKTFVWCVYKQLLLDEAFVISGIIKVEVGVISRS